MNDVKEVILVNEADEVLGTMEKLEAHEKGLLHRAFSIFIFNPRGEMLLQQRADEKYHSGGLWTNTCCSHPEPGSELAYSALQRLKEEMGFETTLRHAFTFIYKASFDNGLTEHEYDHVFTGIYDGSIQPDPAEVKHWDYFSIPQVKQMLAAEPGKFTAWFRIAFPLIEKHFENAE